MKKTLITAFLGGLFTHAQAPHLPQYQTRDVAVQAPADPSDPSGA